MNKKIITIAEIVFALVFVVLLSVFMATINSKGNTANNQLVDTLEMTSGTSLDKYINMGAEETVKGTDVVSVATNYKTVSGNAKLQVSVKTLAASETQEYGFLTSADSVTVNGKKINKGEEFGPYSAPISTDVNYINPAGDFKVSIPANDNGVYDHITFTQVDSTSPSGT